MRYKHSNVFFSLGNMWTKTCGLQLFVSLELLCLFKPRQVRCVGITFPPALPSTAPDVRNSIYSCSSELAQMSHGQRDGHIPACIHTSRFSLAWFMKFTVATHPINVIALGKSQSDCLPFEVLTLFTYCWFPFCFSVIDSFRAATLSTYWSEIKIYIYILSSVRWFIRCTALSSSDQWLEHLRMKIFSYMKNCIDMSTIYI